MENPRRWLNGMWELAWTDVRPEADVRNCPQQGWIAAPVPGDVHQALLNAGKIEEPVYGDNFTKLGWIAEKEWWYRTTFSLDGFSGTRMFLVFEGLDHQADIWLNGTHIATTRNTHRVFRRDVTDILRQENLLLVRLLPYRSDLDRLPLDRKYRVSYGGEGAVPEKAAARRPWMRKPAYTFGWNWTCDLCTCGIWRSVFLEKAGRISVEEPFVVAEPSSHGDRACAVFSCITRSFPGQTEPAAMEVEVRQVFPRTGESRVFSEPVLVGPGTTRHTLRARMERPALWWPAGYGQQNLYEAVFRLRLEDGVFSSRPVRFGVRSVRVDEGPRKEAPGGRRFRFMINGKPVYAQGANWVPADILFARVDDFRRERLLRLARKANYNYLRIWGGGIYEDEQFYRLCDELGIMVWQDFMFACSEYPDFDEEFVEEVGREIEDVVKRLRNHPSIVIWCGNNEIYQGCCHDGFRALRPNRSYYGESLFVRLIPEILNQLDGSRPYRQSSGCTGTDRDYPSRPPERGAGVFHMEVYEDIWKRRTGILPSFVNEWYSGSPPHPRTIERYVPGQHRDWNHPSWRRRDWINDRWREPLRKILSVSDPDFWEKVRAFHVLQAETMKAWMEILRKHLWENSGSGYWMYNDAYPGATKAIVDYDLREKPAFFAARRAAQPILPVAEDVGEVIEAAVVNESAERFEGTLRVEQFAFAGRRTFLHTWRVSVPARSCRTAGKIRRPDLAEPESSVLWLELLDVRGKKVAWNRHFLADIRNLKIPCAEMTVTFRKKERRVDRISFFSRRFIRNICIDSSSGADISDNWFDLCPGKGRGVSISPPVPEEDVSVSWDNREPALSMSLLVKNERVLCVAGGTCTLEAELFNPARTRQRFSLESRAPEGCDCEPKRSDPVVEPLSSLPVSFSVKPGFSARGDLPAPLSLTLEQDGQRRTWEIPVRVEDPVSLDVRRKSGRVYVLAGNRSARPLTVSVSASWEERRAKSLFSETFPAVAIEPGEIREIGLQKNIRPLPYSFTASLRLASGETFSKPAWISGTGTGLAGSTPVPFLAPLQARSIGKQQRPVLSSLPAYLIRNTLPGIGRTGAGLGKIWLFLNYSEEVFFADLFVEEPRFSQPFPLRESFRASSLEIAVSPSRELSFEAVMGWTPAGGGLYVRRQYGRTLGRETEVPRIAVLRGARERITYYSLGLPWVSLQRGFRPAPGTLVFCAFAVNTPTGHVRIFEGIQGSKDATLYGPVELSRPGHLQRPTTKQEK